MLQQKQPKLIIPLPTDLRGECILFTCVTYHLPNHPLLLQTFHFQFDDVAPYYQRLKRYIEHWDTKIEADIRAIDIALTQGKNPMDLRHFNYEFALQ
jgi:uncharacterized protein Usg